MRALITGINGFVGTALKQSLEERGHQVFGMDIRSSGTNVHAVDISDQAAVIRCLAEVSPDSIFHLAAISRVDFDNPSIIYSINTTGTLNLLQASLKISPKPRFLLVSSSQVYGIVPDDRQPIDEQAPISPVNHYGASKAASEHISRVFHYEYDLPVIIVRPFNHIGRGQDPHFVIPKIFKAIHEHKTEIELGELSVVRDFLDVRDVVDVYIRLMENSQAGAVYNISSGRGYRLSELFTMIQEMAHTSLTVKKIEVLLRKNEITTSIGDSSLVRNLLQWRPAYTMQDTLRWMLNS